MCELPKANREIVIAEGFRSCMINVTLHSFGETYCRIRELGIELTDEQMGDIEDKFIELRDMLLEMEPKPGGEQK